MDSGHEWVTNGGTRRELAPVLLPFADSARRDHGLRSSQPRRPHHGSHGSSSPMGVRCRSRRCRTTARVSPSRSLCAPSRRCDCRSPPSAGTTTAIGLAEFEAWRGPADTTAPVVTATPVGGQYVVGQAITLAANEAATIYYTTDGTTPTKGSTAYTGPITLNSALTLRYIAVDTAGNASVPVQQVYTVPAVDVTAPVVTATPVGGRYNVGQAITLAVNEPAQIYYTVDGSTPTTGSSKYASPITLTKSFSLRYFAVDAAGTCRRPVRRATPCPVRRRSSCPPTARRRTIDDDPAARGARLDIPMHGGSGEWWSARALRVGRCAHLHDRRSSHAAGRRSGCRRRREPGDLGDLHGQLRRARSDGDGAVCRRRGAHRLADLRVLGSGRPERVLQVQARCAGVHRVHLAAKLHAVTAGQHVFTVESTNALGNTGTVSRRFTVVLPDTTAPTFTAAAGPRIPHEHQRLRVEGRGSTESRPCARTVAAPGSSSSLVRQTSCVPSASGCFRISRSKLPHGAPAGRSITSLRSHENAGRVTGRVGVGYHALDRRTRRLRRRRERRRPRRRQRVPDAPLPGEWLRWLASTRPGAVGLGDHDRGHRAGRRQRRR